MSVSCLVLVVSCKRVAHAAVSRPLSLPSRLSLHVSSSVDPLLRWFGNKGNVPLDSAEGKKWTTLQLQAADATLSYAVLRRSPFSFRPGNLIPEERELAEVSLPFQLRRIPRWCLGFKFHGGPHRRIISSLLPRWLPESFESLNRLNHVDSHIDQLPIQGPSSFGVLRVMSLDQA